jgi:hypothetical protein
MFGANTNLGCIAILHFKKPQKKQPARDTIPATFSKPAKKQPSSATTLQHGLVGGLFHHHPTKMWNTVHTHKGSLSSDCKLQSARASDYLPTDAPNTTLFSVLMLYCGVSSSHYHRRHC